jgi:thiol-disulfide isomerase/thioredoxin
MMRRAVQVLSVWVAFGLAVWSLAAEDKPAAEKPAEPVAEAGPENPFPKRFPAPSLEGGSEWLNTEGEISLKDLRGKVVLLDFWTYCCINCMHILPDLEYLEKKFPNELVVIGVHSAKFDNEKDSASIRQAIMRYEIEHPVINDNEMTVWRKFRASAWPTIALVDPEGQYCGYVSGEGNREILEEVITRLIKYHKSKGTLDETPVDFHLERERVEPTPLRYPGKILADSAKGRLFISDSNHNRIVETTLAGKVTRVFGSGAIGRADGPAEKASFDHPQGMAQRGETLYIADTENHLLRAIDLTSGVVSTVGGTGQQGHPRNPGGEPLKTEIGSPWDLVFVGETLYIAMAGPHQIWSLDLTANTLKPFAGSGREDILNGPYREAALAQPSGIASDGKYLYVVDSEGSAVRKIDTTPDGKVDTLVGVSDIDPGRALFSFGDVDGTGPEVRLQHPLGIAWHEGTLYVADSYNHRIKQVDPEARTSRGYLGTGKAGRGGDPAQFSEPAGLAVAEGKLYIADTNNHAIRVADLATRVVTELPLEGLTPPVVPKAEAVVVASESKKLPEQVIQPGAELAFEVELAIPEGYKLNPLSPVTFRLDGVGEQGLVAAEVLGARDEAEVPKTGTTVRFAVPSAPGETSGTLTLRMTWGYCREGKGGLCKLGQGSWTVPVKREAGAEGKVLKVSP